MKWPFKKRAGDTARKNRALNRFLSTFSLASRIPIPRPDPFDPTRMDFWLPMVALPVAILEGVVLAGLSLTPVPPMFVALFTLAFQYFAFNLFHLDGLLDTADAFLGTVDKEKRLAILKDSRIGTYAFFSGFLYLVTKLELLSFVVSAARAMSGAGGAAVAVAGILAYPIAGRTAGALIPAFLSPARGDGLGILAKGSEAGKTMLGCLVTLASWAIPCAIISLLAGNHAQPIPLVAIVPIWFAVPASAAIAAFFIGRLYKRGLGGYTGDALGAAVELGELCHLALALWILTLLA
jgi:adenosylcobinamide-GDP ribazoletransferase